MPTSTPTDWSAGVDGVLARWVAPVSSSMSKRSVNVPPTSTPSRYVMTGLLAGGGEGLDVPAGGELVDLGRRQAEQAAEHLVGVLAELGARPADAPGRPRQPGRDVLHREFAEAGVVHADERPPGGHVRVAQHVLGSVGPARGDAVLVQELQQVVGVLLGGPRGDVVVELLLVGAAGAVRHVPLVAGQLGLTHGRGEPGE